VRDPVARGLRRRPPLSPTPRRRFDTNGRSGPASTPPGVERPC
jgi:hypothetical protein